jgi:hypothetical protein
MTNLDNFASELLDEHMKGCDAEFCLTEIMLGLAVIHSPQKNVIDYSDKKLFCTTCLTDYPCESAKLVAKLAYGKLQ